MSIVKIPEERKEQFTLELHPEIVYLSSSVEIPKYGVKIGVTGSAPLRRRPSRRIKELGRMVNPQLQGLPDDHPDSAFNEANRGKSEFLKRAQDEARKAKIEGRSASVREFLDQYLIEVNQSPQPAVNSKKIFIFFCSIN